MGRQDTHDSLIGSLELNISKAIATGGSRRSLSMKACGSRCRFRMPEGARTVAARSRSRTAGEHRDDRDRRRARANGDDRKHGPAID